MILYIDACVRSDSRTARLAEELLKKLDGDVETLCLEELEFEKSDESFINQRDRLIEEGAFDHEMFTYARQFAEADTIVIAAPYWDLSFPAVLKQYIEKICVNGITFIYTDEGIPAGLCKAKTIYYVMTAGGDYVPEDFGYGYIKALAGGYYGIDDVRLVKATGLDIYGADVEKIMEASIAGLDEITQAR